MLCMTRNELTKLFQHEEIDKTGLLDLKCNGCFPPPLLKKTKRGKKKQNLSKMTIEPIQPYTRQLINSQNSDTIIASKPINMET